MKIINKLDKKYFLFFVISISFFSCKDQKDNSNRDNIWLENVSPQLISQLKIKSRTKTEITTDFSKPIVIMSGGKALSPNKIRSIEYFDSRGRCILEVNPLYEMVLNDTTGSSKLTELEKFYLPKELESNVPTGFYDSTFYFYDEQDRLIKSEKHKTNRFGISYIEFIDNYTYDENSNIIQKCTSSENINSYCSYTIFQYNNNAQVISEVDSFTLDIQRPDRPNKGQVREYRYNSNGMVSSIGETNFIYNEKKMLIEKNRISGNLKIDIEYYTYDSYGNCVKIEHIRGVSSTFNPKTNVTTVQKFDTSLLLRQYDKNGLIKESSYKHSLANKNYSFYKYDYTY